MHILDHYVVDAVTLAARTGSSRVGQCVRNLESTANVLDLAIADGDVGHDTQEAVIILVFRRQQNRKSSLGESSPNVFEQIIFKQHALRILEFKMVLNNEGVPRCTTDKARLVRVPGQRLEQMIAADFYIRRRHARAATAEKNILSGRFQKIVLNSVRPVGDITTGSAHSLGIGAGTRSRYAVEVREERVNHGDVSHVVEGDTTCGFVLRGAVHPDTIKNQVIRGAVSHESQRCDACSGSSSRDLEAEETVMVGAGPKEKRAGSVLIVEFDFRQNVAHRLAIEIGSTRKRLYPREAWRQPGSFGRKFAIGSAGAHNDPMALVAGLFRKTELPVKRSTSLQFDG